MSRSRALGRHRVAELPRRRTRSEGIHAARLGATVKLGKANFTVPAGATKKVKLTLSRAGANLLLALGHLTAAATITVRYGTHPPISAVRTI